MANVSLLDVVWLLTLSITTKQKPIYPVAKTIGLLFLEVFRHDLSYSKVHSGQCICE